METDMEVEEMTKEEEESEFETDEEVEEILEEEEEDKDDENFNSFPTIKKLSHLEWPFIDETDLKYYKAEGTIMFKQYKGDMRGVRHLMRLEKEMMDDEGELT
nr:hypothetical protein [Tanacetum cinerariifolium]